MPEGNPEGYLQQRGIGGALGGAAGGAALGSAIMPGVGTAVGAGLGALAGGFGGGQRTQKPFTTKWGKVPDAAQAGILGLQYGVQGNYNQDALLPTNQTTRGFGQGFQQGQQGFPQGGFQQQPQQGGQTFHYFV